MPKLSALVDVEVDPVARTIAFGRKDGSGVSYVVPETATGPIDIVGQFDQPAFDLLCHMFRFMQESGKTLSDVIDDPSLLLAIRNKVFTPSTFA